MDWTESTVRLGSFAGVFAAMALWEALRPFRVPATGRQARWPHNLGLLLVDVALLRLVAPGAAIAVAVLAQQGGWGLLHVVALPSWAAVLVAVGLLDLAVYMQHVLFHAVPTLWRLHRVHHADLELDVTSGTRFHPLEVLVSVGIKCAAVAAIGAPPLAVLVFEVLLNATAVFNHANVSLPARLERGVRALLVTPDMHRIHHSMRHEETSSNFGFCLAWWDRLFGTYRAQARGELRIGVDAFRSPGDSRLDRLLLQPFRDTPGQYPISRREAKV
jgi:sterol desaturase/sphingolipid hydroxylase (fatty acid hydroxylase superfamily)